MPEIMFPSQTLSTLDDQNKLTDVVVIIDVFRSSNTIIKMLSEGASAIIPVETLAELQTLRIENPDWLVYGERDGVKLPGFDGDNSPSDITNDIRNKTIILTTSGGTRCIEVCSKSADIFIGSFANAHSLVTYLKKYNLEKSISFWAVGRKGAIPTMEDEMCAQFLYSLYTAQFSDFEIIKNKILNSKITERLKKEDLAFCLSLNISNVIPRCYFVGDNSPYKWQICKNE